MYEALEPFIEALAYIVDGYCLCVLLGKFGEKRIKQGIANNILTILVWFIVNVAIQYYTFINILFQNYMLRFCLRVAAIHIIGFCFYKSRQVVYLFVALLFIALRYALSEIGCGIRMFLVRGVEKLTLLTEFFNNLTVIKLLLDFIYIFIDMTAIVLLYVFVKFIEKNYRYSIEKRTIKEFIYYVLPTFIGSIVSVAFHYILLMVNERKHIMDYNNYIEIYLFIIVVFVSVMMIILYGFRLQAEIVDLQEERTQKSLLKNQILQMENSMLEMERFYESVRHVKHDMKNQMAVMENLLSKNQILENKEITQYFEDMHNTLLHLEQKIHTGNVVSDAVIGSKFYYAAKELKNIYLDADDFLLTDKVHVRAYDIGIILNNGLDNAIEACKKASLNNPNREMYIKIKSFWKNKMFFIEIENTFDGEIKWGKDSYPCSTKTDGEMHGIGLKNIRYCALKYGGDMDCITENGIFILSVMLKGKE